MAYAYVSAGAVYKGASTSAAAPAFPSSIAAGDLLVAAFYCRTAGDKIALPSGWTALSTGNSSQYGIFGKIAAGDESGNASWTVTDTSGGDDVYAQIARFTGGPSSSLAAHANNGLLNSALQDIRTPSLTITEAGCLVIVMGGKRIGGSSTLPYTVTLASFTKIGEEEDTVGSTSSFVWAYSIQTTATSLVQDDDGFDTANTSTGDSVTRAAAIIPGVTTTKYLKLLAHSSAASATGVNGVVFASSAGIAGAEYGEFTNKSFEATLESGKAVLKVPVADFGGSALTTSDTPVALVRNTTKTTGIISCTVIEE